MDASADLAARHRLLRDLMEGYKVSEAVYTAARLGLADKLADGPLTADALAECTATDPVAMRRFLGLLTALGLLSQRAELTFALSPMGELLRSGTAESDRQWVLKEGSLWWDGWRHLPETLMTGRPGFEICHQAGLFDYLADPAHAELAAATLQGLTSAGSEETIRSIVESGEFGGGDMLIDVGGGNGQLLFGALRKHPELRGVLYDQPYVMRRAQAAAHAAGVAGRASFIGGSFFEYVPEGGDIYLMKSVLHDWDDEQAGLILRNCKRVARTGTRLCIVEVLASDSAEEQNRQLRTAISDVNLMVMTPGRKRSVHEIRSLLTSEGFNPVAVRSTNSRFTIVEGVAR